MQRIVFAIAVSASLSSLANAQIKGRGGVPAGQGANAGMQSMGGANGCWWRNRGGPPVLQNSGQNNFLQQNPGLQNLLNQNPSLQNLLQQNPALWQQLAQNPSLLNQLLQNPSLLNQNGLNGNGANSLGFPFVGGSFFPFSLGYGNYSLGQPGYAIPSDDPFSNPIATTTGTTGDDAWAYDQKSARMNNTYREMRQYSDAQKRAKDRHSPEALAKAAEVPRLGRDELDPVTGKIHWPASLMSDDFAKARDEVERLFEERAWTTQRADASLRIRELAHGMGGHLRGKIEDMTAEDFVEARKFLDGIEVAAASRR